MTQLKDSELTIGIADELTPIVKRINAAVAYRGNNDHEDVRSILKEFRATHTNQLIDEILSELPKAFTEPLYAPDGTPIDEYKIAHNQVLDKVTAILKKKKGEK